MMQPSDPNPQSRLELLAGKVLGDLSSDEMKQLDLNPSDKDALDLFELERTAAALQLSLRESSPDPMPEDIKQRVLAKGIQFLQKPLDNLPPSNQSIAIHESQLDSKNPPPDLTVLRPASLSRREWIAWGSCAASLILALGIWIANRPSAPSETSLVAAFDRFLLQSRDVIRADWTPGKTPMTQPVTGEIVWSNEQQSGFMKFDGLPRNDPNKEQYQLWIIDPARDDEPVDGGVFDIAASGPTIVPIHAKLQVISPTAFAITVEKPGGVVVSTQEQLPLLAVVK